MNEFEIVNRFKRGASETNPFSVRALGTDCGGFETKFGEHIVITSDMMIERIHFMLEWYTAAELARKLLLVNLSDLATQGARPLGVQFNWGIPPHVDDAFIEGFIEGFHRTCGEFKLSLLGGDTCRSHQDLFLSLTLLGSGHPPKEVSAKESDLVYCDHFLGDSAAGLYLLQRPGAHRSEPVAAELIAAHKNPAISLERGQWLYHLDCVKITMDISDGLYRDLEKLRQALHLGTEVNLSRIPHSEAFLRFVAEEGLADPYQFSVAGGEDFHLLMVVEAESQEHFESLFQQRWGHRPYLLGELKGTSNAFLDQGRPWHPPKHFEHF